MEKITLKNGLRILLDEQKNVRTACFGVWAKSGSLYETIENNGISHFIEHMVFKGSTTRSSREIAEQMDFIGGQLNAYTAKDYTCFYARTLDEHVSEGFTILCDMIARPLFDQKDIETEKNVVLEEINMTSDMPDDKVAENQYAAIWNGSSLGLPILGTPESLRSISRDSMFSYMESMYSPDRLVLAISGRFDRDTFLKIATDYFGTIKTKKMITDPPPALYHRSKRIVFDDCEQTHLCICFPGFDAFDPKRHALNMLNIIAGASSSSRLFQHIRENLGLAYSIYSSSVCYNNAGLFEIQTAVNPPSAQKAYEEILSVLAELKNGVTAKEFLRAREQLKSGILMGLEGIASRAGFMGRSELLKNYIRSEDEILSEISGVSIEDVNRVAREVLDLKKHSISLVGAVKENEFHCSDFPC